MLFVFGALRDLQDELPIYQLKEAPRVVYAYVFARLDRWAPG